MIFGRKPLVQLSLRWQWPSFPSLPHLSSQRSFGACSFDRAPRPVHSSQTNGDEERCTRRINRHITCFVTPPIETDGLGFGTCFGRLVLSVNFFVALDEVEAEAAELTDSDCSALVTAEDVEAAELAVDKGDATSDSRGGNGGTLSIGKDDIECVDADELGANGSGKGRGSDDGCAIGYAEDDAEVAAGVEIEVVVTEANSPPAHRNK